MAIQKIEIDTGVLNSDTDQIQSCVQRIDGSLKNMFDEVNEMNTMWKGQANQAYNAQFSSDYETMREMIDDLKEYIQSLQEARQSYDRCEEAVGDIVRAIRV